MEKMRRTGDAVMNNYVIPEYFLDSTSLQKQPSEVFYKKDVLENFLKFTEKHLSQSLFFNKVAGKETLRQMFSCDF